MLKNIILIVTISVVAMIFASQVGHVLRYILMIHDKIADTMGGVFSSGPAGRVIQETIALIVLPVIGGAIAALVYWLVKHAAMPNIVTSVWVVWTILIVSMLSQPMIHRAGQTAQKSKKPSVTYSSGYIRHSQY